MLLETFTRVALAADPPVNPIPIEPRGGEFSILLRLSFRAGHRPKFHMNLPLVRSTLRPDPASWIFVNSPRSNPGISKKVTGVSYLVLRPQ